MAASDSHARYVLAVLISHFSGSPLPAVDFDASIEAPFFVTYKTDGNTRLRGCLGTLSPRPLTELRAFAVKTALHDTRFPPLTAAELPHITASVSVLHDYTLCAHPTDWVVGVHGVQMSISIASGKYSATYLPEVAAEQGWDAVETLVSLAKKAGCPSPWADVAAVAVVTRYTSTKSVCAYASLFAGK